MLREMRGRVGGGHYGHKMKERKGDSQYPVWEGREGGREGEGGIYGIFTTALRYPAAVGSRHG